MKSRAFPMLLTGLLAVFACILSPTPAPATDLPPAATVGVTEAMPTATLELSPSATYLPTIPPGFFPIAVGTDHNPGKAVLLGGAENGMWIEAADAVARLSGGETYTLYSLLGTAGTVTGTAPVQGMPCPQYFINWDPAPAAASLIGLAPGWNALPRAPEEPSAADYPTYTGVADAWLASHGVAVPATSEWSVVRVDLDGDGTREAIISASRMSDPTGHDVGAGDFSVVLLYRESADTTILVTGVVYPEAKTMVFSSTHRLLSVLDLNGDGRMEVIVHSDYFEGEGTGVFTFDGASVNEVLHDQCSA